MAASGVAYRGNKLFKNSVMNSKYSQTDKNNRWMTFCEFDHSKTWTPVGEAVSLIYLWER